MNINTEDLKKKIIYRSTYRGTKEMDALLGSFTKKYINTFNDNELKSLLDLLDLDDENLYKFHQGEGIFINIEKNKVSVLFKEFIYEDK
jgi:antitoxin CptB